MTTKKMTTMALLLSVSLIIFTIESQLPPPAALPGIKWGLAIVVTLIAIYLVGKKEACAILLMRIFMTAVIAGSGLSLIYSLSGGILSFLVMSIFSKFLSLDKIWVTSAFGALAHNIGQLTAACMVLELAQLAYYLPIMMISGALCGLITGLAAKFTLKALAKAKFGGRNLEM